ncbi:uncharacterized protein MELLADRAFT_91075 [Melampsora larici-populina 98AG31]|uniref:Secreted protein n=1 Tax=Melampsora larici-populina (strain 98AG31 / pathotype 3-4-7) TaxID=747676 RepID=F4R723_MELLP|nr:uncharacterized protein MELLADRAFT_91075 [Melampsora larici-populina 98AG31]EGG11503.1 hypothetical protein MELLADRAFT_91075 [Melampsora larici-populina 98AG31]
MIHFLFLLVSIATVCVKADDAQHTGCYGYFLNKDGCVHGSSGAPCSANSAKTSTSCNAFKIDPTCEAAQQQAALQSSQQTHSSRLARRYDTTIPTLAVAGGNGICGFYDSNTTLGVCLWSGEGWVDSRNEPHSGWLNGTRTENCQKQVYIQRQGKPETVQYARVLDGCGFNAVTPDVGCFQVWMTIDLFDKFGPTPEERTSFQIDGTFTWDFVDGSNPV